MLDKHTTNYLEDIEQIKSLAQLKRIQDGFYQNAFKGFPLLYKKAFYIVFVIVSFGFILGYLFSYLYTLLSFVISFIFLSHYTSNQIVAVSKKITSRIYILSIEEENKRKAKIQFTKNRDKWREHYSKLKAKRGI